LGLVLFLLLFYKDVDYLSFILIFIYKKKNTDDVLSASLDSGHHCVARNIGATPFLVKKTQFLNHFNPKHTLLTPLEHP
jgi:hypothetical protein